MPEQWGNYSVAYQLDGKQWALDVRATSEDDAMRRVQRAAAFGKADGPWSAKIPAWHGRLWVPLYITIRNLFMRLRHGPKRS